MDTAPPPSPPGRDTLRILVVEDEPLLRWAISESLAAAGHVVVSVADGAAAIEALVDPPVPIDAILLDYRLPDSNDLGLLVRLQQLAPGRPVVMMTACSTPELRRDAIALGAYQVIDKPFEMQAIEACLRDARAARDGER